MMAKKLYRIQEAGGFRYPPTGRIYAEHETDPLQDWHKDDIKAALSTGLIIEIKEQTVGGEPALIIEEDSINGTKVGP